MPAAPRKSAVKTAISASARRRTAETVLARLHGKRAQKRAPRPKEATLPMDAELQTIMRDFAFGDIWSRPGLPMQVRSMITMGILTALYRTDQLRIHVNMALNLGLKPEQILEVDGRILKKIDGIRKQRH